MKTASGKMSWLFLILFSSACTTIYTPSAGSPGAQLGRDDAEVGLIKALKAAGSTRTERCGSCATAGEYEEILAGESNLRFTYKGPYSERGQQWNCPYAGTPAPRVAHVTSRPGHDYSTSDVDVGGCTVGSEARRNVVVWGGDKNANADRFTDALFVLARGESADSARDAEFQKTVQQYRAAGGRLPVGEEVRAHRVAAEAAVKEKRFEDAMNEYGEALKLAPWWPQGHFNRALILAELGAYGAASRGMKRYLLLEPGADNARQVQDKIYEWQAKVR